MKKKNQELWQEEIRQRNSGFFDRIEYVIRFVLNIFAVFVLKVDHRMLDFKTYKEQKREPYVFFGPDTLFQRRNIVLGEIPNTLENARSIVNSNDQAALIFY